MFTAAQSNPPQAVVGFAAYSAFFSTAAGDPLESR
jgi:hypothetical protein